MFYGKVQTDRNGNKISDSGKDRKANNLFILLRGSTNMDLFGYSDRPIENIKNDSLNMSEYVNGLSDFIKCCETPMTIAIKGEWGSGKTSLMRMIQNNLTKRNTKNTPGDTSVEQTANDDSKDTVGSQTINDVSKFTPTEQTAIAASKDTVKQTANDVPEEPVIIPVWFDTWKFSAMELGNQLAISMLGEILHALDCDSTTIRKMLGGIAKLTHATLPLVTEVFTGLDSLGEMLRGLLRVNEKEHYGTEVRELQNRFHEIIQRKIKREKARRKNDQEFLKLTQELTQGPYFSDNANREIKSYYFGRVKSEYDYNSKYNCLAADRVVIFIDDLDRIQPDKAVDLLEILKAFLDCPNSVFVLAIDFELVSLGVNIKYKNNISAEKNKGFFDKMVQLPFTMPITNYDLDSYIEELNVFKDEIDNEKLKHFIEHSVGANPRKIKRIFNLCNLNRITTQINFPEMDKSFVSMCVFVLACMQEQYPDFLAFLANNNFDRFVFEPFLQPDDTAVYQYHDIFENRDKSYIQQQLEGLKRFIPVFMGTLDMRNKKYTEELNQKAKAEFIEYERRLLSQIENDWGSNEKMKEAKLRQAQKTLYIAKKRFLESVNRRENFKNFKEIIRFISVSNLGIVINPKIKDVANNKDWLDREFNIKFVKEVIFMMSGKTSYCYPQEWSVLTPVKTDNGIKISNIIGYKKFNTDMFFDYKFEFRIHKEMNRTVCVDYGLHVYPNYDLQKNYVVKLMGDDPLSLSKTPHIKILEGELSYYYINAFIIQDVETEINVQETIDNHIDSNLKKFGDSPVELVTDNILETLSLFQKRFREKAEVIEMK